jgi:hypothetical protein
LREPEHGVRPLQYRLGHVSAVLIENLGASGQYVEAVATVDVRHVARRAQRVPFWTEGQRAQRRQGEELAELHPEAVVTAVNAAAPPRQTAAYEHAPRIRDARLPQLVEDGSMVGKEASAKRLPRTPPSQVAPNVERHGEVSVRPGTSAVKCRVERADRDGTALAVLFRAAPGRHPSRERQNMFVRRALFAIGITVSGCSAAPETPGPESSDTKGAALDSGGFVDARSYFTAPDEIDSWYALMYDLKSQFDTICGDTFCEGDYSNYESLGVRCSVEQATGKLGRCVWTFAASTEEIRADNGALKIHGQIWKCRLPVPRELAVHELVRVLSSGDADALYTPVPGMNRSFYDALVDCL